MCDYFCAYFCSGLLIVAIYFYVNYPFASRLRIINASIFFCFRCCCGSSLTHHRGTGAKLQAPFEAQWLPSKHTVAVPTDAHGTIEFQGGPHPSKAQVSFPFHLTIALNRTLPYFTAYTGRS